MHNWIWACDAELLKLIWTFIILAESLKAEWQCIILRRCGRQMTVCIDVRRCSLPHLKAVILQIFSPQLYADLHSVYKKTNFLLPVSTYMNIFCVARHTCATISNWNLIQQLFQWIILFIRRDHHRGHKLNCVLHYAQTVVSAVRYSIEQI